MFIHNNFTRLVFFVITILFFSVSGCDNSADPDSESRDGELEISVLSPYFAGVPVAKGVKVLIKGIDSTYLTDSYGKVYIKSIREGTYEVNAFLEELGSAMERVKVIRGNFTKLAITLSTSMLFEPDIVKKTDYLDKVCVGDSIKINFKISDNYTPSEKIYVEITDNFDGSVFKGFPQNNGNLDFNFISKKKGIHLLRISAKDEDGYVGRDSIFVYNTRPPRVELRASVNPSGGVDLSWTKCSDSSFARYEVGRVFSPFSTAYESIKKIDDINTLTFTDLAPLLEDSVYYEIISFNDENEYAASNLVKVTNPFGKLFPFNSKDVVIHPTLPYLYITTTGNQLILFNYETQQIIKSILLLSTPNLMEIGDNGMGLELYVPDNTGIISIYDPISLNKTAFISCGFKVNSVAIDGQKHVFAGVEISNFEQMAIRSFNRVSGNFIDGIGKNSFPRLRVLPDKKRLFSISDYVSYNSLEYAEFDSEGKFTKLVYPPNQGAYTLNLGVLKISPLGNYAVTGKTGVLISGTDFSSYKSLQPYWEYSFSDFDFDNTGTTIYAATDNKREVKVYNYVSREVNNIIYTKGYPFRIFVKGNLLVTVSKNFSEKDANSKTLIETRLINK